MRGDRAVEQLGATTCLELLASGSIGRVILTEQAMPTALPVAYALDKGTIVFRSSVGTKLAAAAAGTVIAFEVDDFDADRRVGWSVVVTGLATVIAGEEEEEAANGLGIPVWVQPDGAQYIRLQPSIVTGRRVGSSIVQPSAIHTRQR